ncbi:MAG TPA: YtxH domain-containing protein [Chitinophagaceae bacterium]|nr:YtxH domain-containing protein [Chitinophagaceae bacterium]
MNKLLIGFSAGLLLGILFAPAKGSETRNTIARKGQDLKDRFNDMVDSISEKFESVEDEAEDMVQRQRQRVRTVSTDLG